ncbi:TonB-dependent receptor [Fulvivirgaceae bacterium BMA12]|uniref:TonB-dependent receptor n=1 Tax=Agaribacillus aureus TaxID=3051825 RepID=A0ABT8L330_9BACT|nr:TonB-dependent receptor [Fulvivirgaceae bacterium BMA12]
MVKKLKYFFRWVNLLVVLWLISVHCCLAQRVRVVDKDLRSPIENVTVYTENGSSMLTDKSGIADISGFKHYAVLYFQHPGYVNKSIPGFLNKGSEEIIEVDLTESVIKINEIVISANRWEQSKDEIPHKIVSVSPKNVIFNNPQTSADLLESSGQVFVQKSQLGGGSPMIRGFAANSVLIVVDGIRMNNAIFRSGNLQNVISIDPNILEKAEVVFGPGSVIYGSDALGGVMSFQTKKLAFSEKLKPITTGNAFIRTSTANNEKTLHANVNIAGKKLSALTSITYSDYDDLNTGRQRTDKFPDFGKRKHFVARIAGEDRIIANSDENKQVASGYNQLNLMQKLGYKINPDLDIVYTLNYSTTSDIPRYDRLIEVEDNLPVSSEWYYGPQRWMMNSLQFNATRNNRLFDRVKVTLGYQHVEESRNTRDFQDPRLKVRRENVNVFSGNFDFEKELDSKRHVYYGFEGLYNDVKSSAFIRNIDDGSLSPLSTRYPSGGSDYTSLSTYLTYQWKLNPKLNLNAGVRFSYVRITARVDEEDDIGLDFERLSIENGALNGSLGLVFKPRESWQFDVVASTGFRSPNIDDIGKVFDGSNNVVIVPNQDLKPEYTYNLESSVSKVVADRLKLSTTLFITYLDNAMVQGDFTFNGQDSIVFDGSLNKVEALINTGSAYIYGGSFNALWDLNHQFSLATSLTYNEGEDLSNNEPLRHTAPFFTKTSLSYKRRSLLMELSLKTAARRKFEDLAPSERNKTHLYTEDGALGWQTINLKAAYQFNPKWNLTGGVENILDKHYRPYSSGISAPGRNFYLALRHNF